MATTTPFRGGATATAGGEKKQRGRKAGPKNQGPKKLPQRGMGVQQLEELRKRELWWSRAAVDEGFSAAGNPDHRFQVLPPPSFHDPLAGSPVHYTVPHHLVGAGAEHAVGANSPDLLSQYLWALHHRTSRFGDGSGSGSLQPRLGDGFGFGFGDSSSGSGGAPEIPYNLSSHRSGVFKKKRTEHYGLPDKAPVTGHYHYTPPNEFGPAPDHAAVHRKILESSILMGRKICHEHQFFPQKINGYNFIDHESPDARTDGTADGEASIDLSLRL